MQRVQAPESAFATFLITGSVVSWGNMKSDCVVFVLVDSRTCAMIQCLCACLLAASALRWSHSLSLSLSISRNPEPFLVCLFTLHVPCICLCAQARTSSLLPVLHRLLSWVRPSAPARVQFLALTLLAPALCWGCVKVRARVLWAWSYLRPYGL